MQLPTVHPTVVHMLAEAARRAGEATALVLGESRLTYAQYLRCVAGFARELVGRGARFFLVAALMRWGGERMEARLHRIIDRLGWASVAALLLAYALYRWGWG